MKMTFGFWILFLINRRAVALMSWNDLEIRHRGKFSYQVPVDECKVSLVGERDT